MVDIQTISIVLASASVITGVVYYAFQIRHQARIRKTDLIMKLYSDYRSNEFREALIKVVNLQFEDYEDYVKKYGSWFSDEPAHKAMAMVAMFFEGIGILLRRKLIDVGLASALFGTSIMLFWEKMKPVMLGLRKQANDPKVWEGFEDLYNEILKRKHQQAKIG
ncbi:MAG: hypothetical protein QW386_03540 [Candidatus Bathyarchaeia archaeon]